MLPSWRRCPTASYPMAVEAIGTAICDESLFSFSKRRSISCRGRGGAVPRHFRIHEDQGAIVNQDEREGGIRAILNLGHTIGHGIEAISQSCCTGVLRHWARKGAGWGCCWAFVGSNRRSAFSRSRRTASQSRCPTTSSTLAARLSASPAHGPRNTKGTIAACCSMPLSAAAELPCRLPHH